MSKKNLLQFVIPCVLVVALLGSFQNCSKNKGDDTFYSTDTFDFESETPEVKTVVEGDDVVLTVPQAVLDQYFPDATLTCKWSFDTDAAEPIVLSDTDSEYRLDGAQVIESGRYTAECTQGTVSILIHFVVIINELVTPDPIKDTLVITISDESTATNETIADIIKADAIKKCRALGTDNPLKSVKCVWGTTTIFNQVVAPIKKAVYEFISVVGTVRNIKALADLTEKAALAMCLSDAAALLKATPTAGYECFWDKVSFKKKMQDVKKDIYRGFFIVGDKLEQFIETKDISRAAALANCKLNATNNPTRSVVCTWGKAKIFSRIVPVDLKKTYKGYFINKGVERLFITTMNITKEEALANCKLNHSNNLTLGIRCTWDGKNIFRVAQPVK